ncbi:hypothetical protein [Paraburkholderia caffeinilytica]|nr:hypothetical protein [Paraburkholderia caffeinilytica]
MQSLPGSAAVGSRSAFRHVALSAIPGFPGGPLAIGVLGTIGKLTSGRRR